MVTRVNGGIITDQMLTGDLRYFKMTGAAGAFTHTVGQGIVGGETTIIPGQQIAGDSDGDPTNAAQVTYQMKVGVGQPVPNSIADRSFAVILARCTVTNLSIISGTEIHFAVNGSSCGWATAQEMMTGVEGIGGLDTAGPGGDGIVGTGVIGDPAIPDDTANGMPLTGFDLGSLTISEILTPIFAA